MFVFRIWLFKYKLGVYVPTYWYLIILGVYSLKTKKQNKQKKDNRITEIDSKIPSFLRIDTANTGVMKTSN